MNNVSSAQTESEHLFPFCERAHTHTLSDLCKSNEYFCVTFTKRIKYSCNEIQTKQILTQQKKKDDSKLFTVETFFCALLYKWKISIWKWWPRCPNNVGVTQICYNSTSGAGTGSYFVWGGRWNVTNNALTRNDLHLKRYREREPLSVLPPHYQALHQHHYYQTMDFRW